MKKIIATLLTYGICFTALAQKASIERIWFNAEKTSKIQIYKAVDGKYYGKIVWLQEPVDEHGKPRTDVKNPKENQRNVPLLNFVILKTFTQDKDDSNIFEDGTVYDPKSGKTYCGKLTVNGKELKLKGFICGFSLLSRSSIWTLAE
ncbi:hypothetical protein SAMN05421788_10479 [Filimonas lacunae]|uniref:DUF2147 domain-containing protein n=1 Tax=Filimonas lacunae TaxID=477680 RepID=A0A173M9N7_9BACT|nr:DUF2147 domain-containing protein [Filimonas lacunae]BAV04188.1 hypothetical protein FLA_0167 [Filimonas lacunae]SIT14462.1 hypothetical protein SAMN05421788_10479 [Filimonas lacunae]